jgi:hypothetical protein
MTPQTLKVGLDNLSNLSPFKQETIAGKDLFYVYILNELILDNICKTHYTRFLKLTNRPFFQFLDHINLLYLKHFSKQIFEA